MFNFKSILDVTKEEWLSGLCISEKEIPDIVIQEGSWWREERQKLRLIHLESVRELGFPDIYWGKWQDKKIISNVIKRGMDIVGVTVPEQM